MSWALDRRPPRKEYLLFEAQPATMTARAVATASEQSEVLEDLGAYDTSVAAAEARISDDPGFVSKDWRAWCLEPESVEFWQADSGRRHQRWLYRRGSDRAWTRAVLWP